MKTLTLHNPKRLIEADIEGVRIKFRTPTLDEKDLFLAMVAGGNPLSALKSGRQLVSWCLKEVQVKIKDEDGNITDFKLDFDENGYVTNESMEILGQFPMFEKIRATTMAFVSGTPDKIYEQQPSKENPKGKELEGVKILGKKRGRKS